jgi:hypothetical protein
LHNHSHPPHSSSLLTGPPTAANSKQSKPSPPWTADLMFCPGPGLRSHTPGREGEVRVHGLANEVSHAVRPGVCESPAKTTICSGRGATQGGPPPWTWSPDRACGPPTWSPDQVPRRGPLLYGALHKASGRRHKVHTHLADPSTRWLRWSIVVSTRPARGFAAFPA